jgi:xanthine dehydrogenase YagS FAD-binding subunit
MNSFTWIEPTDVASAIAAGAQQGALFKAGGVDVTDLMKEHVARPTALVNLRRVGELDFLREEQGALAIGPLVTLARLRNDPRVVKGAAALAQAARVAATPQIRNLATLGGNLAQRPRCPYFRSELFHCRRKGGSECFAIAGENQDHAVFDNDLCAIVHPSGTATALVALRASLKLKGPRGERTLPIDQFFVRPGQDVTRENVPWRATAAEKALAGAKLTDATARQAARLATQGAKPLDKNKHKVPALQAAVLRSLRAAGGLA